MRKLCLTFVFILIALPFTSKNAYSGTHKKKSKKQAAVLASTTPVPAPTPAPATVERNHGVPREKLSVAYTYAKSLYAAKQFDKAKDIFKKLVVVSTDEDLNANSLYLYSQCSFRTEDYTACVKALTILAERWPETPLIKTGYVTKFCYYLINEVANLQTNWDYYRFKERTADDGSPLWKESIPPGFKIKRINFKLGFGLYRVLKIIQPTGPVTADAKKKLDYMLNAPITMVWVDEKAPPNQWGHPGDFLSYFSTNEKKDFSNVICERMFFDWKTEKFYQFLDMYDDVRNLKPRFIAKTKEPDETDSLPVATAPPAPGAPVSTAVTQQDPTIVLTLSKLFLVSGYNPYDDSYTSTIESSPIDLNL
jgi:tetratricopeptide (TPR) repeat protein